VEKYKQSGAGRTHLRHAVSIPGILAIRSEKAPLAQAQQMGSLPAGMTAEKPADSQNTTSQHPGESSSPGKQYTITNSEASPGNDAQAMTMLYEHFRRPIHSYVYRMLGSLEDADDLTQEVFMRAFAAWNDLYERDNLSAWLYRIATNLCVDLLRRRKRISWWPLMRYNHTDEHPEARIDEEDSYLPTNTGGIPEIAEREHIQLALASMPLEYAVALILNTAQGISYQEIAHIAGISPNAAATRISRAKRMFAEHYQRLNKEVLGDQEKRGSGL
jgi:RNA polymerase sigma-70 factor (ECF subfamily)